MIWRRIKNLWKLSGFHLNEKLEIVKDFPTIEKKLAAIIKPKVDLFEEPIEDGKNT